MRGRLFLLNVLLLAGIAGAAMEWKKLLAETRKREEVVRRSGPVLPEAKPVPGLPGVEKTTPADYLEVASRLVFSRDRSPVVEPPPPPAPPQIPAFPLAYGVLMISDPPIVMMSPAKGQPQKGYRPGDRIGEFKIARVTGRDVTFEWEGKKFVKTLAELADREAAKAFAPPEPTAANSAPATAPAAAATSKALASDSTAKQGPGAPITPSMKQCQPGDPTPDGAIVDGYKKMNTATPFGFQCRWEKVQ